ncbi:preprotein translocase subunit SecA [Euzebya tangerina]|uniref:preprotein translocase subunit SecA n=1 Tax=Euzebya tangerina TaxID=591198 RepID=UPI000E3198BD|nr:preprotein translocase subunit SecA [Euzebya tangerina]
MVLQKLLRLGEGRQLKQLWKLVEEVNALESDVQGLTDAELRGRTDEFKARLADGETLDDLMFDAYATCREAAQRVLGQRAYDVQILGGIVIHQGSIAEMRTGEGKTLTSVAPVYLNALSGDGVHVVTVNPYLASRDAEWMGRVYSFLGLSTGYVYPQQKKASKREAYACDITYGTNNELGFDYLRDHMVLSADQLVQRGHNFAIVDEIDSILVDEARTPLIISGPADQSSQWYEIFARRIAPKLKRDEHYEVDEAKRTVGVTEEGVEKVEELLGVGNLYENANTPLIHHLQNAIKAKELFRLDDEYIIEDGEVLIVDENTGRTLKGRRYSEGLHQAIEAKEGVTIKDENQTLATITLQNYFRTYDKLSGMTGTAKTEEKEFAEVYEAGVVVVPTNRPIARVDHADQIYKSLDAKMKAVIADLKDRQERGQPVLVGTVSVERSEELHKLLKVNGIKHEILNAKNHFREADIVAQAGRKGAVTVATNMAGRGVDIMLGGNPENLATKEAKREAGSEPVLNPETGEVEPEAVWRERYQAAYDVALEKYTAQCEAEKKEVLELGGLYVLATERHDSRRIDNQLRGRSGRQGDPGESRFYLSLEDDLMRLFNASAVENIMTRLNMPEDLPIEAKMVTNAVARAQAQVESRNYEIRKNVLKYDDVMNSQRKIIYAERDTVLHDTDEAVEEIAEQFVEDAVSNLAELFCPPGVFPEEWDVDQLEERLQTLFGLEDYEVDIEEFEGKEGHFRLREELEDQAMERYGQREEEITPEAMRQVERRVILSVVDRVWREHLYEMDQLRDGIGLRAVGQRDPLVEYQREAYNAFVEIQARIKEESVGYFFNLPVKREQGAAGTGDKAAGTNGAAPAKDSSDASSNGSGAGPKGSGGSPKPPIRRPALDGASSRPMEAQLSYSSGGGGGSGYQVGGGATTTAGPGSAREAAAKKAAAPATVRNEGEKVGRNDPCPCGSGQKYKRCHGG